MIIHLIIGAIVGTSAGIGVGWALVKLICLELETPAD